MLLALQPLGSSYEALVDGLGTGSETALEHRECETHGVLALAADALGAVHPLTDVVGDVFVEVVLERGQLVGNGLCDALGEELLALEGQEVFLDHAAHDAADVRALLLLALETVTVEQREEELEVLLLARVRGRGHQEQVAGDLGRASRPAGSAWSCGARHRSSGRPCGAPRRR